jgi:hypothetical protein
LTLQEVLIRLRDDPLSFQWRRHGIGFIKAYLDEERNHRLNIYHEAFLTPNITIHHDHPWHFISRIICGELVNTKYGKTGFGKAYHEGTIYCNSPGEHRVTNDCPIVVLNATTIDYYNAGDSYAQFAEEIHTTEAKNGTMTLLTRAPLFGGDGTARVYWPIETDYVDADLSDLSSLVIIDAVEEMIENAREHYLI